MSATTAKSRIDGARGGQRWDPPENERTRGYQLEMFDESLKRNIVVTMDTGSGKTHIAVLRIRAQLEKGEDKLCWFLVPNVSLGLQQYEVLKAGLPPVNIQFLSGGDKIDKWSDQNTWDQILGIKDRDYAVVVSTHQVLLDALTHGFVRIESIGLMVFDEAHHCVSNHPANRIMQEFYHPCFRKGKEVPAILGLTASPVMKSTPDQLRVMESNLNAISRTPVKHRDELMKYVNPPKLKRVVYSVDDPAYDVVDPSMLMVEGIEGGARGTMDMTTSPPDFGPEKVAGTPEFIRDGSSNGGSPDNFRTASEGSGTSHEQSSHHSDDGEYETIDASGEPTSASTPVSEGKFELIDPKTGELYKEGDLIPEQPAEEYELIDPETGEPYINPPTNEGDYAPGAAAPSYNELFNFPPRGLLPGGGVGIPDSTILESCPAYESLMEAYKGWDFMQDPYMKLLLAADPRDERAIEEAILKQNTYCQLQIRGFVNKATHIKKEFGRWAVEFYIRQVVQKVVRVADDDDPDCLEWDGEDRRYLKSFLRKVTCLQELPPTPGNLNDKVEKLISVLLGEYADEGKEDFAGLVFVEQRVGVSTLAEILRSDPRTKDIFKIGTVVGHSDNSSRARKIIYEPPNLRDQAETIEDFRTGKKNLVISTSVVEEGMDVPACHLVVCFSLPQNLKSFIQRRGRARMVKSSYVLMFHESDTEGKIAKFKQLEMDMIEEYLDEKRKLKVQMELEKGEDEDEDGILSEGRNRRFQVESTGALLTLNSAVSHLHHFCACLPHGEYMDSRPIFTTRIVNQAAIDTVREIHPGTVVPPLYKATVLLPNCIAPEVRLAESEQAWETEKWAKRDAAFQAYVALRQLEVDPLVDDHMMPLLQTDQGIVDATQKLEKRPSKVTVEDTIDPWAALGWEEDTVVYATPLTLTMHITGNSSEITLLTPVACPAVEKVIVYRTNTDTGEVVVGASRCLGVNPNIIARGRKTTTSLLLKLFGTRMNSEMVDFPYLFIPKDQEDWVVGEDDGPMDALQLYKECGDQIDSALVMDRTQPGVRYSFRRWRPDASPEECAIATERYKHPVTDPSQPLMEVVRVTGRRDFLHCEANEAKGGNPTFLLPEFSLIDRMPWKYWEFALFLPGTIHRIGLSLIAADAERTLFGSVGFFSTTRVVEALCASSAREDFNYQRLEFLGDSVLKLLTSANILDEHPFWHEGYLTRKKEHLVSNSRLARAAMESKLSRWIITDTFTAAKWKPHYIKPDNNLVEKEEGEEEEKKKPLSTKVLADVVESLIGAAYLEGGYSKALKVIRSFGLKLNWKSLENRAASLLARASNFHEVKLGHFRDLEKLIGYEFSHKALLLEAVTHPSCVSDLSSLSYQRMEFLGDAVLDMIVVNELYFATKDLTHIDMHHYKSSAVNGNFLAYLSMGYSIFVKSHAVEHLDGNEVAIVSKGRKVELWKFIRHQNQLMGEAQRTCWKRYDGGLRDAVRETLDNGTHYPWTELAPLESDRTGRNKFLADIVEALIGAVYVDSGGNFEVVKGLIERLGIFSVLGRLVRDRVDVTHPVKKLGETIAADGQGTVQYVLDMEQGVHSCAVVINGEELIKVRASGRVEARTKAADLALHVYLERRRLRKEEEKDKGETRDDEETVDPDQESVANGGVDLGIDVDDVDDIDG